MKPQKRFGQHFLRDTYIISKIVNSINPDNADHIAEVGPGTGALTAQLLPIVGNMDVIELDRNVIPQLENSCKNLGKLNIYNCDALKFDFSQLITNGKKLRLVGNLPYNISTPLLFHFIDYINIIEDMYFMLQKEVVDRITATPGGKKYGRLTVMINHFCQTEKLFDVMPEAFYPPPKVMSSIIKIIPRQQIDIPEVAINKLQYVTKQAFQHRRKTIRNCFKNIFNVQQLISLDIDPKLRPEQLTIEEFIRLAQNLQGNSTDWHISTGKIMDLAIVKV